VRADNMVLDGNAVWNRRLELAVPGAGVGGPGPAAAAGACRRRRPRDRVLLATAREVDPAGLDAAIAWLGALMLLCADQPVFEGGSPWIRPHQLWTGEACLSLLRARWDA